MDALGMKLGVVLQHLFSFRDERHARVHPSLQKNPKETLRECRMGAKSTKNLLVAKQTHAVGRER